MWRTGPENVLFWDLMDFVGVDAYYPLASTAGSTLPELIAGWQASPVSHNITAMLAQLHRQTGKPIMFTEIGCDRLYTAPLVLREYIFPEGEGESEPCRVRLSFP